MLKVAALIKKNASEIAKLEFISVDQPLNIATHTMAAPVAVWRYYAGLIIRLPVKVVRIMVMVLLR